MTEISGSSCAFFKLVRNGKCSFDEFEDEITKNNNFKKEFIKLLTLMDWHANGRNLPPTSFKNIKDGKHKEIFVEFKTKHLRVYAVCTDEGKVVVLGGTKNTQKKDIEKFKRIAIEFVSE